MNVTPKCISVRQLLHSWNVVHLNTLEHLFQIIVKIITKCIKSSEMIHFKNCQKESSILIASARPWDHPLLRVSVSIPQTDCHSCNSEGCRKLKGKKNIWMIKNRMSVFFLLSIFQSFNIDSRRTISDRAYRNAVTFGFRVPKFCLCRQSLRRRPCWRLIHMTSAYRRYASTSRGPWGDNHGVCPVHGCRHTERRSSLGPARHLKQSRTKSSARYSQRCE